jgi:hypothetical protein
VARAALERMRALPEFETDEEHRMSQITHEDDSRVAALVWLRYGVPAAMFLLGCVLLAIDGGGEIGWEGFFMATGAALSVLLLNPFYRLSVSDERVTARPRRLRATSTRVTATGRTRTPTRTTRPLAPRRSFRLLAAAQ